MPMNLRTASQLFFALTMMGVGLIGLIDKNFASVWAGVPQAFPGREVLVYVCAVIALVTGAGMSAMRSAAPASLLLLGYLSIWTIAFKGQFVVRAPLEEGTYQSIGENTVLIAAAWVLYGSFVRRGGSKVNFFTGEAGIRAAYVLYGLGLVAFGLSHFFYLDLTAPLVPKWLPQPVFWAYLTGAIYLATGAAIVMGIGSRLAAGIVALQIALITLLVWGPMVLSGELTPMHWQETVESCALTAGAFVLAAFLESVPSAFRFGRRREEQSTAQAPQCSAESSR
jgi:uncharacterized membrane protein